MKVTSFIKVTLIEHCITRVLPLPQPLGCTYYTYNGSHPKSTKQTLRCPYKQRVTVSSRPKHPLIVALSTVIAALANSDVLARHVAYEESSYL